MDLAVAHIKETASALKDQREEMEEGLNLDSLGLYDVPLVIPERYEYSGLLRYLERCFTILNSMYVVMTPNDSCGVFLVNFSKTQCASN